MFNPPLNTVCAALEEVADNMMGIAKRIPCVEKKIFSKIRAKRELREISPKVSLFNVRPLDTLYVAFEGMFESTFIPSVYLLRTTTTCAS